ncbi:hypothetical protein C4D60_Mb03t01510 [Musa balbisiana]|uniref:Uncharacterized protein n=1 Tax=Musa balbisiana TaxID=52838 RepID=A0A4S8J6S5_MUSBA|nr:hypothetical protein C4D60_Mb03t01510 [Musa balbisiana]
MTRKLEAPWLIKAVHVVVHCKIGREAFADTPTDLALPLPTLIGTRQNSDNDNEVNYGGWRFHHARTFGTRGPVREAHV